MEKNKKGNSWLYLLFNRREFLLIFLIVLISLVVKFIHPDFLTQKNIDFILVNSVVLGLIAIGQTFVILTKGIDLSVAPIMGLGAVVTGLLATNHGLPLWVAFLLAISMGIVLGMFNGWLISFIGIPAIIVTLGTLSLYGGLMFIYTNGVQVTSVPNAYSNFGNGFIVYGVPTTVLILFILTIASWYVLRHTVFGRNVYAVGNNVESARNAGISVKLILFLTYTVSGAFAGLAGLIYIAYTQAATATTGTAENIELQSIAAVLIGGTAIAGGRGGVLGSTLGSIFMTLILTALIFLKIPAIWDTAGEGTLILIAIISDVFINTRSPRKAIGGEV